MTNFFGLAGIQNTAGDIPVPAGAAPSTTAGMQGNPNPPPESPNYPPAPQTGATQVLGAVPDTAAMIAQGAIPHNAQPTNANVTPGGDSLLAQIARGQLSLNQSNYGQGAFVPQNAGASPQAPQPGSAAIVPITAGNPATPTFANPANYTGN